MDETEFDPENGISGLTGHDEKNLPMYSDDNGRRPDGTFAQGNSYGKGNPQYRKVARLRMAMLKCVTPEAIRDVCQTLIKAAKKGDVASAKLLLSYALGKPDANITFTLGSMFSDFREEESEGRNCIMAVLDKLEKDNAERDNAEKNGESKKGEDDSPRLTNNVLEGDSASPSKTPEMETKTP